MAVGAVIQKNGSHDKKHAKSHRAAPVLVIQAKMYVPQIRRGEGKNEAMLFYTDIESHYQYRKAWIKGLQFNPP
jgi:hypothetical protein